MWKVVEVKYECLYYQNSGTIINVSEFGCNEHKHVYSLSMEVVAMIRELWVDT